MITYFVSRDTARTNASDEDRAMAHESIYSGPDLTEGQAQLRVYMIKEVEWLSGSIDSIDRAEEIRASINEAATQTPSEEGHYSRTQVVSAGIAWSITRTER